MEFKNVVVAGGGVLGSQIAFQTAYCGFNVTIWLRSEGSITRTQPKLDNLKQVYIDTIKKMNTPEIMAQDKTDSRNFDKIIEFAKEIRMIPLPVRKEKSGYLLNSMLVPLLFSAMDLYVNEISDIESIDTAWTLGSGAEKGPFKILDTVGLTTAYNIVQMYVKTPSFLAPYNFKGISKMLKKYIDEGKLGMSSGEGFYKYNKDNH